MRYFSTPDAPCQAVCPACAKDSTCAEWVGWRELDPEVQQCAAPTHCARCDAPLDL